MKTALISLITTSLWVFILTIPSITWAKTKGPVSYSNKTDSALTLHSVTILPTIDNVDGIFSKPFDKKITTLIEKDHQWEHKTSNFSGAFLTPDELIKDEGKVQKIAKSINADGVILIEVRKNPKALILSLNLFSAVDGKLIAQAINPNLSQASTDKAVEQLEILYRELKQKIPYDGLVLSRTQNRVTVNLGQQDGITPGQTLTISRIINAKRHPKLGFIMSHEKALVGKIKVLKVDKALSFADIVSESEKGAVQVDSKITGARPVSYQADNWIKKAYLPTELALSENNKNIIGGTEKWRPETPPTFGRLAASVGAGPYKYSLAQSGAAGTLNSEVFAYPSVNLLAEAWINPEWYVTLGINQGTSSISNPAGGSQLSASSGQYTIDAGYNLLLLDDFWNSKLYVAIGYFNYEMDVDQVANGLTSTEYSSMRFTFGGKTPIDNANRWIVGANLYWYLNPKLVERPVSSGGEDSRIVHFTFLLDYRWSERLWLNGELDFKTFTSNFSGTGTRPTPATQSSQKFTTLNLGVSYMF